MSTSSFLFPDVNVWFALQHQIHPHHALARAWGEALGANDLVCFCRFTQLGLLRLLTNRSAMGEDALTPAQAWKIYDAILAFPSNRMLAEPRDIDPQFRKLTNRKERSTKQWADGYLAAFATASGSRLVTFDRTLAGTLSGSILLAES